MNFVVSQIRPEKAHTSLRFRAVSSELSPLAHTELYDDEGTGPTPHRLHVTILKLFLLNLLPSENEVYFYYFSFIYY